MVKGTYKDVLTGPDGRIEWNSGWRPNLIVTTCNVLMTALMKGEHGVKGISYWAVGQGQKSWDGYSPSPLPSCSRLDSEIARHQIAGEQIVYLDDAGSPVTAPTSRIEVSAEFRGGDFVSSGFQPLREFGVFGGDASEDPDSGLLVDYIIHPRIDLSPGFTLNRKLRLSFSTGVFKEKPAGLGAGLPVISIDGIGAGYAKTLGGAGIFTLGDLAAVDTSNKIGNIPQSRLREFRAKAGLVIGLPLSRESALHFAEADMASVIDGKVATGGSYYSSNLLKELRDGFAALRMCIDEKQMKKITMKDLVGD